MKGLFKLVGLGCLVLAAPHAEAVAPRAYVSVTGVDGPANMVCSNPATPCRTFTGAIAQLTPGGEVIVLDSGTFGGGTITISVTINSPAGVAALAATPLIVNAGPSDVVTIRGLTFVSPTPGVGTALTFNGGAGLNLENCVFHGWFRGLNFASAGKLNVADTTFRENTNAGVVLLAAGPIQASFERTRVLSNGFGVYVSSNAKATFKGGVVSGNNNGLFTSPEDGSLPELTVEAAVASHNNIGAGATVGATLRISSSTVTNNATGLYQFGTGVVVSRTNNTVEGNTADTSGTIGTFAAK